MSKFTNIAVAAVLSSAALVGGAASAFADDYYQGADPNPTYIHGTRVFDGQNNVSAGTDRGYTGSIGAAGSTAASNGVHYTVGGATPPTPPRRGDYYVGGIRN